MEEKNYELTNIAKKINGHVVYRIKCINEFKCQDKVIKVGQLGGFVESYDNLSDNAWIDDDSVVYGDSEVSGNAYVCGNSIVHGSALVFDEAYVCDDAEICENAWVFGRAYVSKSLIFGSAKITGNVEIKRHVKIGGLCKIQDDVRFLVDKKYENGIMTSIDMGGDNEDLYKSKVVITSNVTIKGSTIIRTTDDFMIFHHFLYNDFDFIYTKSNEKWSVGDFYGNSAKLLEKMRQDSDLNGKFFELCVNAVENDEKIIDAFEVKEVKVWHDVYKNDLPTKNGVYVCVIKEINDEGKTVDRTMVLEYKDGGWYLNTDFENEGKPIKIKRVHYWSEK